MTARWIVLVLYLALMIGIGVYYRRKSASVNDFVLGGRGLGAWFTAFAYGTSYFSAVIFVGYAGKFGWNYGVASTWERRHRLMACTESFGQTYKDNVKAP